MGRELKRKQAKREGKNVKEVQKSEVDKPLSWKSFVAIILGLFLVAGIFYIIGGVFITKDIKWFDKDETTEEIVTNKILGVNSLKQTEEEYYVYFYSSSEKDSEVDTAISSINDKVYHVDLDSDFNSRFVGEPSGIVSNIEDLRVENPTIMKVVSGNIKELYSGSEEIKIAFK